MKNITYRQVTDYMIPNLTLPPEEAKITLGKWGMLHKDYLLKNKKVLFNLLLIQGKLYQHCVEVEKQAQDNLLRRKYQGKGKPAKLYVLTVPKISTEPP